MAASVQYELAPGVAARVFAHDVGTQSGDVACWSYVTEGLRAHRQREIVFTLARPPGTGLEHAAREPLQLLGTIAQLAQQGHLVNEGGITELGPNGLFGVPALRGLVYQAAWPMDGVVLPPGALAAVALVGPEMETAKRFGVLRVLARLGRAHRFFPTAGWCVPQRGPVMGPESGTVLEGVASAHVVGVSVLMAGDHVVVRLSRAAQPTIRDGLASLPGHAALALLTALDPSADGCLVWSPGQNAPEAISAAGAQGVRIAGCFALFVPQQPADAANPFEDGFAMMLTDGSWARVREAMAGGWPMQIPGNRPLVIEWVDPPVPAAPEVPAVGDMRMHLRESQADIEARVGMQALVQYAEAMEKTVQQHFAGQRGPGASLQLEVLLSAGYGPGIRVSCWPDLAAAAGLQQRLAAIPMPPIRFGEVGFQGTFALWGGA